jgi:uncharacterized protein with von Willebrand factor type A (vWA) domain
MIVRQTSLSANVIQFCRFLRHKGFTVGVEEEAIALRALQCIDYTHPELFRQALKATLCRNKIQAEEFDEIFDQYWKQLGKAVDARTKEDTAKKKPVTQQSSLRSLKTWLHGNRTNQTEETATYSIHENISRKDFSSIPEEDVDELMKIIKAIATRLAAKSSRRYKTSQHQEIPDLRQTLRKNLRRGGELLEIAYRKHPRNRVKILMLCDVSKSMELYTVFLVQFMYAFQQVYKRMETFVFGTSLKRLTPVLKEQNFRTTLQLLTEENSDWAGGTRIGECLNDFVENYSKNLLDSKTIVLIVSDGWDKGNMDLLQKSMDFIQAKSKKIIWLNPLAGFAFYRPDVAGMQTAMPYIDVFAPVHNVESLRQLGKWL